MRRTKILFLIACVFAISFESKAQETSDLGTWSYVQMIKPIGKSYAMARAEHRSCSNVGATESYFFMVGGGYNVRPWLKADLSYEHWNIPVASNLESHRAVACVNASLKRENLTVALRERYELAFNVGQDSPTSLLRTRLRAQYSIENTRLTPYMQYETFNGFSSDGWQRSLHYVGTEVKLGAKQSLDLFYMYHLYPSRSSLASIHILGIGYVLVL